MMYRMAFAVEVSSDAELFASSDGKEEEDTDGTDVAGESREAVQCHRCGI